MPVTGKGKRKILIVAEAPGKDEDAKGVQLIGDSGQLLRKHLRQLGVDLDRDCWKTNSVICRPIGNATPTDAQINACRPNLLKTIQDLQPTTIILLGWISVKSLIGWLWKDDLGTSIGRWVGWRIPCQRLNTWICPTWHPSYLLRMEHEVLNKFFSQHLSAALKKKERPWDPVPHYEDMVKRILDPAVAAKVLRKMVRQGGAVAVDYETNMLKPDSPKAQIVTCSVCWRGERTIAFPWHGEAIEAMKTLWQSPLPKIASNLKFEERWTRRLLGFSANNWAWDTMIAAHVLDNRPEITGLKFQSFVNFGMESYDDHIAPLLKATRPGGVNRIKEIELRDLLLYNGLDSLLEYLLAERQMRALGTTPGGPWRC